MNPLDSGEMYRITYLETIIIGKSAANSELAVCWVIHRLLFIVSLNIILVNEITGFVAVQFEKPLCFG